MKTVLMELIEELRAKEKMHKDDYLGLAYGYAADLAEDLLEKEKQQIIDARDDGFYSGTAGTNTDWGKTSLQYYNETFKPYRNGNVNTPNVK